MHGRPLVPLSVPAVLEPEPSLADLITCRDARTLERAAQQVFPVFCFQLLDLFNALNSARQLVRRSFLFFLLHVVGKGLVTPREEQLLQQLLQLLNQETLQPLLQALPPEVGGYLLPLAADPVTAAKLQALGCQPSPSVPPPRSVGDRALITLLRGDAAQCQRLLATADLESVDLVFVLEEFLLRRSSLAPYLPPEGWELHAVAPAWVLMAALLHAGLTNNVDLVSLLLTLTPLSFLRPERLASCLLLFEPEVAALLQPYLHGLPLALTSGCCHPTTVARCQAQVGPLTCLLGLPPEVATALAAKASAPMITQYLNDQALAQVEPSSLQALISSRTQLSTEDRWLWRMSFRALLPQPLQDQVYGLLVQMLAP